MNSFLEQFSCLRKSFCMQTKFRAMSYHLQDLIHTTAVILCALYHPRPRSKQLETFSDPQELLSLLLCLTSLHISHGKHNKGSGPCYPCPRCCLPSLPWLFLCVPVWCPTWPCVGWHASLLLKTLINYSFNSTDLCYLYTLESHGYF